jgi:hypothetical protein
MMSVKKLIQELLKMDPDARVLISSDEELNCLRSDIQICVLGDNPDDTKGCPVAIYGLDGSEVEL